MVCNTVGSVSVLSDSVSAGMIRTSGVSGSASGLSGTAAGLSDSVSAGMIRTYGVSGSASRLSGAAAGGRGSESQRGGSAGPRSPLPEFSVSSPGRPWRLR